jgi:hypothetical protein
MPAWTEADATAQTTAVTNVRRENGRTADPLS